MAHFCHLFFNTQQLISQTSHILLIFIKFNHNQLHFFGIIKIITGGEESFTDVISLQTCYRQLVGLNVSSNLKRIFSRTDLMAPPGANPNYGFKNSNKNSWKNPEIVKGFRIYSICKSNLTNSLWTASGIVGICQRLQWELGL